MVDRSSKISASVVARLDNMTGEETIPVIILIGHPGDMGRRGANDKREQLIVLLQEETKETLQKIDQVLETYGGRRLEAINSLGAVPVVATAPAVIALASIESVRSIIEDQPLRGVY
jgi:hypothetical protein